jgi:hypothetical protein
MGDTAQGAQGGTQPPADAGSQGTQGAQGTQPAQGAQQSALDLSKLDSNDFFKLGDKRGKEAAQKQFDSWLADTFGTTDREELAKLSGKIKKNDGQIPNEVTTLLQNLKSENEQLKARIEGEALGNALRDQILESKIPVRNMAHLMTILGQQFDFKPLNGQIIAHRKDTGAPIVVDNQFANVKTLMAAMAKDANTAYMFGGVQNGVTMPEGGTGGNGGQKSPLKPGELTDTEFVQALKDSGQLAQALKGDPVDRDALKAFMKKPLTAAAAR